MKAKKMKADEWEINLKTRKKSRRHSVDLKVNFQVTAAR